MRRATSLGKQLANILAKVGSLYPLCDNFRLTPEVKQKFTEKLRSDPAEFSGSRVADVVGPDGLKLILADGVGMLPPVGHGAGGARVERGLQQGWPQQVERGSQSMDLRLGPPSRARIFPRPEDGLRVVMEQAPRAEAVAARWVERTRPAWAGRAREWRLIGSIAAILLVAGALLHAMLGPNGLVVYRQKRAEVQLLRREVDRLQKENTQYAERIKQLKSDPAAIEKEAREQLHYTRKGEVVFVAPEPPQKPPTGRAKNDK